MELYVIQQASYYSKYHRALRYATQYPKKVRKETRKNIRASLGDSQRWSALGMMKTSTYERW